jgi:hypothetical protein
MEPSIVHQVVGLGMEFIKALHKNIVFIINGLGFRNDCHWWGYVFHKNHF